MSYDLDSKILTIDEEDKKLLMRHHFIQNLKRNPFLRSVWQRIKAVTRTTSPSENIHKDVGDIVIVFRHVYISSDNGRFPPKSRPAGFSHDACFVNLVDTIKASHHACRARVIVFYNGTREQFESDRFSATVAECGMPVQVRLVDASSAVEAVLILMKQASRLALQPNDILYLLENDYIHHRDWLDEVYRLYESDLEFDYVSLYDHPDRYRKARRYEGASLFSTSSRHWITAASTCGTFMMRFEVFLRDFDCLYSTKSDHQMFSKLTGSRGRRILTPVPGLSLHCMSEYLDPVQDLEKYFLKDRP
jgi:hypothetical protein